ncbi:MAG: hypothetical protein KKH75_03785 [Actinobacteria bacterium]|nr:hypothetical protein [Actinomycetota bacterium]
MTARQPVSMVRGSRVVASAMPVSVGLGAVLVSLGIAVYIAVAATAPVSFFGVPLPLVISEQWWLSLIGYLLTPFTVIACYGWDATLQRNGLRRNRNFVLRPAYRRALVWAVAAGIVLGAWHAINLSVPLSELWGLS